MSFIDTILDMIFGSKDVIQLIKEKNYEQASKYGDKVCYNAVNNNEDWIWDHVHKITEINNEWNSCSYGNAAMFIHYGSQFPERTNEIKRIKKLLKDNLNY
jgi:hypothetical protein